MGSVAETAVSAQSTGHLIQAKINKIRSSSVTLDKTKGHFVSQKLLTNLEEQVEELMASQKTSLSDQSLIKMHDELSALRAERQKFTDIYEASKMEVATLTNDLDQMKTSYAALQRSSAKEKAEIQEARTELVRQLKEAKASKEALRSNLADPEELAAAVKEVNRLNNDLQAANKATKLANDNVTNAGQAIQKLERRLADEQHKSLHARSRSFAEALKEAPPPLEKVETSGSMLIDRAIGQKGKELLQKEAALNREEARNRAFYLLQAAQSIDPKNWIGYKNYMNVVFNQIKSSSYNNRKKYLPLLDKMAESLKSTSGPKLSQIRTEFENLVRPSPVEQAESIRQAKEQSSWWAAFKVDYWIFTRRISLAYREAKQKLSVKGKGKDRSWLSIFSFLKFW